MIAGALIAEGSNGRVIISSQTVIRSLFGTWITRNGGRYEVYGSLQAFGSNIYGTYYLAQVSTTCIPSLHPAYHN
jgi:hypothetical protein